MAQHPTGPRHSVAPATSALRGYFREIMPLTPARGAGFGSSFSLASRAVGNAGGSVSSTAASEVEQGVLVCGIRTGGRDVLVLRARVAQELPAEQGSSPQRCGTGCLPSQARPVLSAKT